AQQPDRRFRPQARRTDQPQALGASRVLLHAVSLEARHRAAAGHVTPSQPERATMGDMAFLMRVELPDVPGSLGALATALGEAGADIEAIEIVEHRSDGFAVDDVLLELPQTVMPDALVTACHSLDGVHVHWISRYTAGANLSMDLEAVEAFTDEPDLAIERLVEVIPATFRTDWALAIGPGEDGAA